MTTVTPDEVPVMFVEAEGGPEGAPDASDPASSTVVTVSASSCCPCDSGGGKAADVVLTDAAREAAVVARVAGPRESG